MKSYISPPLAVRDIHFVDDITRNRKKSIAKDKARGNTVGLHINTNKIEAMVYRITQPIRIYAPDGGIIKGLDFATSNI